MKAKVAAGAIIAIMGIGLIAFTVSQSQAQTPVKSDDSPSSLPSCSTSASNPLPPR